ncbi:MAG TPA: hypothetical protein VM101_13605 [Flavitalea sp.]|nr:hypothetical protein [Flavitalea sp.]
MKSVEIKIPALLAGFIAISVCNVHAQDTTQNSRSASASAHSSVKDSARYSDTGFVNNAVKQHIIEYKVAEMALKNAERPKIKQLARDIMQNDREALSHLLANNTSKHVEGVSQKDLDSVLNSVKGDKIHSTGENIPQGITGNTVNEDLGSGSSGSGNVHGKDTGTIARTHSKDEDGYSAQGDYAYNNGSFLANVETMKLLKGNNFENEWLNVLLKMQDNKINQFSSAIDLTKDDNVRGAAIAGLPRAKMLKDNILRVIKNMPPSRSIDPNGQKRMGDDNINRKNAPR